MPTKKPTSQKAAKASKPRAKTKAAPARPAAKADAGPAGPVMERGDLFFFYRPDVDETSPGGLVDIRRFHLVLRPEGGNSLRLITVGRKKLPEAADEGRSFWAFVERVFHAPEGLREWASGTIDQAQTVGERHLPEARPAGEGVYALVRHGRSSILAYALELPEEPGEVQRAFHIERQGQYVVSVKNPEGGSPAGAGLEGDRRAEFPGELMERFGDRRWAPADPPAFLDHEGAELVLIGGREAADDLGIDLDPQPETEADAEVFRDLHLERSDRTLRPLFDGSWE